MMDDYHKLQLEQLDTLSRRMSNIFEQGAFSDCTVVCGKRKWEVHRVVLATTPYFKSQFTESKVSDQRRYLADAALLSGH